MWKAQALRGLPSSAFLSADLGDLFNFWKLLISFFSFFFKHFWVHWVSFAAHGLSLAAARKGGSWMCAQASRRRPRSSCCRHGLQAHRPQWLQRAGLTALRHAGSNPYPPHLQADSFSLYIREAPTNYCFLISKRAITISTPHSTVMVKNLS